MAEGTWRWLFCCRMSEYHNIIGGQLVLVVRHCLLDSLTLFSSSYENLAGCSFELQLQLPDTHMAAVCGLWMITL